MARVRGGLVVGVMVGVAVLTSACQSTPEPPRALPFPSNVGPPQVIPLRSPVPIYGPTPSESAPSVTSPSPRRPAGLYGCGFVSRREAQAAAGTALDAGVETRGDLKPPVVAHTGCRYQKGTSIIQYDVYVISPPSALVAFEEDTWAALGKPIPTPTPHATPTYIIAPPIPYQATIGNRQVVVFPAPGVSDLIVVTGSQVKAGAAMAVFTLMEHRM